MGTSLVTVFENGRAIGHYERNLPIFGETTFAPFESKGSWFALYSPDYTGTRIMALPSCEDLGGEDAQSNGFCPVDFLIPRYRLCRWESGSAKELRERWEFSNSPTSVDSDAPEGDMCERWRFLDTAFVAGCIWGDDSSWKLEVIDLANAHSGRLVRSARFGYLEIANKMHLADAVHLARYPIDGPIELTVYREEQRDLQTGVILDPLR